MPRTDFEYDVDDQCEATCPRGQCMHGAGHHNAHALIDQDIRTGEKRLYKWDQEVHWEETLTLKPEPTAEESKPRDRFTTSDQEFAARRRIARGTVPAEPAAADLNALLDRVTAEDNMSGTIDLQGKPLTPDDFQVAIAKLQAFQAAYPGFAGMQTKSRYRMPEEQLGRIPPGMAHDDHVDAMRAAVGLPTMRKAAADMAKAMQAFSVNPGAGAVINTITVGAPAHDEITSYAEVTAAQKTETRPCKRCNGTGRLVLRMFACDDCKGTGHAS